MVAILLILGGAYAWVRTQPAGERLSVRTAEGGSITILDYHFEPGRVRYEWHGSPIKQRLARLLPAALEKLLGLKPRVVTASFPTNEAGLSIAFWPRFKDPHTALRLILSDEAGNAFDEAVHDAGWSDLWVQSVKAFPRRGKELRIRLASGTNVFPELIIPNPDPGPHPQWTADPLPIVSTNQDLLVKLMKFEAFHPGPLAYTGAGLFPRTRFEFEVIENGEETVSWEPISLEFSDATGNRWEPSRSSNWNRIEGGRIHSAVSGALWEDEEAWKARLKFRKTGGFFESERVRLERIPIPVAQAILQPRISGGVQGVKVEILAVIGENVEWDRIYQWNPDRVEGAVTLLIKGDLVAEDHRLAFVRAFDDRGRELELIGSLGQASQLSGAQFVPYSLNFKPGSEALEITVVVGVARSKEFEFLAKPEQIVLRQ